MALVAFWLLEVVAAAATAAEWSVSVSKPVEQPRTTERPVRVDKVAKPQREHEVAVAASRASAAAVVPRAPATDRAANTPSAPAVAADSQPPGPPPGIEAGEQDAAVKQYCKVVMDQALKIRIDIEKAESMRLQKEVVAKIEELDKAIATHASWVAQREAFQARAQDALVRIYATMPAEAAAVRLAAMDELVASAIISKLSPKNAGALLAEMERTKAARLSAFIAGAAEMKLSAAKAPSNGGKP